MPSWIQSAVFYHIYPLGFCGAPEENKMEQVCVSRILKVEKWIPHLLELGVNAVYFGPLMESTSHGYDTMDYHRVDKRLGSNEDFKEVCEKLHASGIRVVLDGVFNHVGRDFFAFKDLQLKGINSPYIDWFQQVNFGGKSPYGDSFWYEGWEGHFDLVKLNLKNPNVINYLLSVVEDWIETYHIDGLRLDVAYCMDQEFLKTLAKFCRKKNKDFWLMGEIVHGDYARLAGPGLLDSVTNYECYKGIYSSHNDKNYFEINYSLNRLLGNGGLYKQLYLYNFVDNHDVTRLASILKEKKHLKNVYTLLFTMPGIPSIYYGSEWGVLGEKGKGTDKALRPKLELEDYNKVMTDLVEHIHVLADLKKKYLPLQSEGYEQVIVRNEQLIFARNFQGNKIYVGLNLSDHEEQFSFEVACEGDYVDVLEKEKVYTVQNKKIILTIPAFAGRILVAKDQVIQAVIKEEEGDEHQDEVVGE